MSDLPSLQHLQDTEMTEIQGNPIIEQMQPYSSGGAENATAVQPSVAESVTPQQEFGHISAPFGDVVNPNAPRDIASIGPRSSGKAFNFGPTITGTEIVKAGTHNATTWNGVQSASNKQIAA